MTVQVSGASHRRFLVLRDVVEIAGPARILGHDFPLFQDNPSELFDAELRYEKFDSRGSAIFLFAQSREYARDSLSDRQQFFFGQKRIEQFRLLGHCAEPAADVKFEAALLLAILHARLCDDTHVVHVHERARLVFASREGDLELPAKPLRIRMAQHEFCRRFRIRRHIEHFVAAHAG